MKTIYQVIKLTHADPTSQFGWDEEIYETFECLDEARKYAGFLNEEIQSHKVAFEVKVVNLQ